MPFYEYQCRQCGHHVEVLQRISDPPLRKCPSCGRQRLERLMSRVAFRLKGGGWYETDFKSEGEQKRNLVAEEAAPAAEAKPADAPAKPDAAAKAETPAKPEAAPAKSKGAAGRGRTKTPARAKPRTKATPAARSRAKPKPTRGRR